MMLRDAQLGGQTLLVIGGSSGIGLETARRAHAEGAAVIITARDPERLHRAGLEVEGSIAAFDATDFDRLARFFAALPTSIDHVLVTGPVPNDVALAEFDIDEARRDLEAHLLLPLQVARAAANAVRPGGTLLFTGCIDGEHSIPGRAFNSAITAALSAMTQSLASELAPIRVNMQAPLITAFVQEILDCARRRAIEMSRQSGYERLAPPFTAVLDEIASMPAAGPTRHAV